MSVPCNSITLHHRSVWSVIKFSPKVLQRHLCERGKLFASQLASWWCWLDTRTCEDVRANASRAQNIAMQHQQRCSMNFVIKKNTSRHTIIMFLCINCEIEEYWFRVFTCLAFSDPGNLRKGQEHTDALEYWTHYLFTEHLVFFYTNDCRRQPILFLFSSTEPYRTSKSQLYLFSVWFLIQILLLKWNSCSASKMS